MSDTISPVPATASPEAEILALLDKRLIVLVGMMGAGKSTVGKRCASRLERAFVDTDEIVATIAGASVWEIFSRDGEAAFRALERTAVADACADGFRP